jgi:hypothetical protein
LSKTVELPGQQALIARDELPEGAVAKPDDTGADRCESFAEWRAEAAPYFILRAAEPGRFTAFDCIRDAPARIRNPRSDKWPGILMAQLHHEGVVEHAMAFGLRLFDTSHRPASGGSAVSVWVGVEGAAKAGAA